MAKWIQWDGQLVDLDKIIKVFFDDEDFQITFITDNQEIEWDLGNETEFTSIQNDILNMLRPIEVSQ